MANAIVEQEAKNGVKVFGITENLIAQVSMWNNKKRVDIRRWFQGEDGNFYRSKKGLNITTDEWDDMVAQIDELDQFVREQTF